MTDQKHDSKSAPPNVRYESLTGSEKQALTHALTHGASRREAMQMMIGAGMTIATAGSVVTAASEALAATPKKGGTVRCATHIHGPDDTLDPIRTGTATDYGRGRASYNNLIQLDDKIIPKPELAEEFEANADASEWTFKIRPNVEFHDGSKLTADDVVYSMSRHLGEKSTSVAKGLMKSVKEVKKTGPLEVKMICDSPYADLAAVLGEKQFKIIKDGTTDFSMPPGTGPFRLKEYKPGIGSIHVRNDNYWREGANLDAIEIFGVTDPIARVNALLSGDVQLATAMDPKALKQIEGKDGVEVLSVPSGSYLGICLNTKHSPGNNPDFVMAMKHLQRRDRIVKTILKGQGTVGNDNPINTAYGVDFCDELPIREYDPDKAKALIKKSGVTEATIDVAEVGAGITDIILMLQRECSKVGFNLKVKKVPTDGFWGSIWQKTPMNVTAWNMRPTATIMLDIAYAPGAPWSDTWWSDPRMGDLLKKAKSEVDAKKRHVYQCEMQKIVSDNAPVVIPCHRNNLDGKASKVKGMPTLALGELGASEWPEFIWLDG